MKPRRDPSYVYDQSSVNFLERRNEQLQSSQSDSPAITTEIAGKDNYCSESVFWSDIDLPVVNIPETNNVQLVSTTNDHLQNLSSYQGTESQEKEEDSSDNFVNKTSNLKRSSTRLDFLDISGINLLDLDNCFLSASSAVHTNTSEMGDSDNSTVGEVERIGRELTAADAGAGLRPSRSLLESKDTLNSLLEAVGKIDNLTTTVLRLENAILQQGQRLDNIEELARSSQESSHEKVKS